MNRTSVAYLRVKPFARRKVREAAGAEARDYTGNKSKSSGVKPLLPKLAGWAIYDECALQGFRILIEECSCDWRLGTESFAG
jgi:hypothetical protein